MVNSWCTVRERLRTLTSGFEPSHRSWQEKLCEHYASGWQELSLTCKIVITWLFRKIVQTKVGPLILWSRNFAFSEVLEKFAILGAFAKLRKKTISFIVSVCPSVRPSDRPSAWSSSALTAQISTKFDTTEFLKNLPRKIQVSLKSAKNNGYFM